MSANFFEIIYVIISYVMKKNVLLNTVSSIYYSVCQWVMTVAVVWLSPDYGAAGILGLAMAVTNSFATVAFFGMRQFQISDVNNKYSFSDYIISRRVTSFVGFALCALYLAVIGTSPMEAVCVLIYMALRLIEAFEDVYQGIYQRLDRYDLLGMSNFLRGTLQIISFVVTFKMTGLLWAAFAVMTVTNLGVLVIFDRMMVLKQEEPGPGPVREGNAMERIIPLLKECIGLVVYQFAVNSLATVVRVALRERLGQEVLGIYSSVASPTVIINLLASVIFTPFIPGIAVMYNERDKAGLKRTFKKIILILAVCFAVINVGVILLGRWGLGLLYGPGIAQYVEYLLPLAWCMFFIATTWLFAGILIAMRKTVVLYTGALMGLVADYILCRPLIDIYGANGASFAQAGVEIILTLVFAVYILKEMKE